MLPATANIRRRQKLREIVATWVLLDSFGFAQDKPSAAAAPSLRMAGFVDGLDGGEGGGFGIGSGVLEYGRLLPQTIPHPIRGETAKRMGHPGLGLGDGFEVLAAQAGALAAAAGGEDVAALVTGFDGFHRVPPSPGGL